MNLLKCYKNHVKGRLVAGLLFIGIAAGCSFEKGEFHITNVSQRHYFTDSASFHPSCCVVTTVTGTLDAPAVVVVQSYLIGGLNDSIHLPKGNVNVKSHQDNYWYKKIAIKYFPGEAKKGNLTIKTSIY